MAQQETGKSRWWIWALAAVVVAVGIYFLSSNSRAKVAVRAAQVEKQDLVGGVSTNGKVEPIEEFQAHAPMPGVVQAIPVSLGQHVERGQELIRMDATEAQKNLTFALAQLQAAQVTLQNMEHGGSADEMLSAHADMQAALAQQTAAQTSLTSLQRLQAQGAASANEVASAHQRLNDAQAKVTALKARSTGRYSSGDLTAQRAQVVQAQSAVEAARSAYANVDIHSPIAGTVYALPVAQYDFVPGGDALMNVANLNKLQVRAYFDEPEIGKLATGQPVKIVWDAKPGLTWHGHILQAPTTVITYGGTRNVGECLITVDDAKGDLLPNTNVTVTVTTMQKFNVLSLPREALHPEGTNNYVFKIVDGALVKTPVQIGTSNLTRFEVTGGLQAGDIVALGPVLPDTVLTNGLQVKVQQ